MVCVVEVRERGSREEEEGTEEEAAHVKQAVSASRKAAPSLQTRPTPGTVGTVL